MSFALVATCFSSYSFGLYNETLEVMPTMSVSGTGEIGMNPQSDSSCSLRSETFRFKGHLSLSFLPLMRVLFLVGATIMP